MSSEFSLFSEFSPFHRGGDGPPMVCLHGFMDTWRVWELVLPSLERQHDVLALTLPGHAGGVSITEQPGADELVDGVEAAMDEAGLRLAHLVGNSLGGYVALRLAARGRAASIVAFAPAGGWTPGDPAYRNLFDAQRDLHTQARAIAPRAGALLATPEGRRRATRLITSNFEHLPIELLAHQVLGVAKCSGAEALLQSAVTYEWPLQPEQIDCPVRIVWGTADQLLPWPGAAARYRQVLPQAEWVLLEGVGHCPQLDVPVEAAQLILGFTSR